MLRLLSLIKQLFYRLLVSNPALKPQQLTSRLTTVTEANSMNISGSNITNINITTPGYDATQFGNAASLTSTSFRDWRFRVQAINGVPQSNWYTDTANNWPTNGVPPSSPISKKFFGLQWWDSPYNGGTTGDVGTYFGVNTIVLPSVLAVGGLRLWDTGTLWKDIEKSQGSYTWTNMDWFVNNANALGWDVYYTMGGPPQWYAARPNEPGPYGNGTACEPADISGAWYTWCQAVANRYKGKITHYGFWNEAAYCDQYGGDSNPNNKYYYLGNSSINPTIPNGSTFTINGVTVTTGSTTTVAALVASINSASIPGVTATLVSGAQIKFKLTGSARIPSGAYYSMTITDGTNTPMALCGITATNYVFNGGFFTGNVQSMQWIAANTVTAISAIDSAAKFVAPSCSGDAGSMRLFLTGNAMVGGDQTPNTNSLGYKSTKILDYHPYRAFPDVLPILSEADYGGQSNIMYYMWINWGASLNEVGAQSAGFETWLGEFGWWLVGPNTVAYGSNDDASAISDLSQLAINLCKYYCLASQMGFTRVFLYGTSRGSQRSSLGANYGPPLVPLLVNPDNTLTVAGKGYNQMARWLQGATPGGFTVVNATTWACRYTRGSDQAYIVWRSQNQTDQKNYDLMSWPGAVQYETLTGSVTPVTSSNGLIPIGRFPVLVQFNTNTWGTAWP
jgi:hypothetical protein